MMFCREALVGCRRPCVHVNVLCLHSVSFLEPQLLHHLLLKVEQGKQRNYGEQWKNYSYYALLKLGNATTEKEVAMFQFQNEQWMSSTII